MVRTSVVGDALKAITTAERLGRRQVLVRPVSKVLIKFLQIMQRHGYIGDFEVIDDHRSGKAVINLTGRINKAAVISPRFDVKYSDLEKWEANVLPSRLYGSLVLTTSSGILDNVQCREKRIGGKIIGFFF
eukprot:CAMPEP_0168526906 /NCGR_PEP_ID=MMETSP0405-20121227/12267_1 /TAXON_ID=498012 /ORGANISM="Trichosphaerium sp, Strain Am-I-7 wt" /LENGTH=130 /DNA_ID=CAMNT_0008549879 /DNA_START=78 /DNA_END=470 /DNA_ORIENTATION=-